MLLTLFQGGVGFKSVDDTILWSVEVVLMLLTPVLIVVTLDEDTVIEEY